MSFGDVLKYAQFGAPVAAMALAATMWEKNPWIGGGAVGYVGIWFLVSILSMVRNAKEDVNAIRGKRSVRKKK